MYVMLELLKFDDILDDCLINSSIGASPNDLICVIPIFVPLMPQHGHQVRSPKLNYPPTRLEVHRQSTIFKCEHVFNSLRNLFYIPMSSYQLKKSSSSHLGWISDLLNVNFFFAISDCDLRGAVDGL